MFLLFLFLLFSPLSSIHHRDSQILNLIHRNREDEANSTRFSLLSVENSEGLFSFSSLLLHAFPCLNSSLVQWPNSSASLLFPCLHGNVLDNDAFLHFKMSNPNVFIPPKCSVIRGIPMDLRVIEIPLNLTLRLNGDNSLRIFPSSFTRNSKHLDRPLLQFSYVRRDEDCELPCANRNYSIYSTPLCLGEKISEDEIEVCDMTTNCKWESSNEDLVNVVPIQYLDNEKYMTMNGTNERVTYSSPYIAHTSVKCSFIVDAFVGEGSSMDLSYSSLDGMHHDTLHLPQSHTPFKLKPFSISIGHFFSPIRIEITCHQGSICQIDNLRMKNCEDDSPSMKVCPLSSFLCSSSSQSICLPLHRICDLIPDCTSGEDESNCDGIPSHALCDFSSSSILSFCPQWISSGPLDGISFGESKGRKGNSMRLQLEEGRVRGEKTAFTSPPLPPSSHRLTDSLSPLHRSCTLRFSYCASVRWTWTDFRWMINGQQSIWDLLEEKNETTEGDLGKCEWKREVIEIPIMSTAYSLSFEIFSTRKESNTSHFELADVSIAESCFIDDSSISPIWVYNLWPCNGTGPLPPSIEQCQSFYSETDETEQLVMERSGWIRWIAPMTNEYRVELCGASGGSIGKIEGGKGGCIVTVLFLKYHEELEVMIGQLGEGNEADSSDYASTAGGGATVIRKIDGDPSIGGIILVAGGGGGISREMRKTESANGGHLSHISEEEIKSAMREWKEGDAFSHAFGTHFNIRCYGRECDAVKREANRGGRCNSSLDHQLLGGYGGGGPACGDSPGPGGGFIGGQRYNTKTGGTSFVFYEENQFEVFEGVHSGSGFIRISVCSLLCPFNHSCVFQSLHRDHSDMECQCMEGVDCTLFPNDGSKLFLVIGLLLLLGFIFLLFLYGVNNRKSRYRDRVPFTEEMEEIEMMNDQMHDMDHFECIEKLNRINIRHIPRGEVIMKKLLGKGAFGEVHLAEIIKEGETMEVAVKTLTLKLELDMQLDFTFETLTLHKLDHVNIVRALGINTEVDPYYLIIEYMKGGDLRTFLRLFRSGTREVDLTMKDFLSISLDIANGCSYLEENHVVHRDLAARNCLLTTRREGRTVKLADFGMARDIYSIDYYRKNGRAKMPVKWLPPESYLDGKFDGASDRWAFGVLLWEVFSLGHMPYPGMNNYQVMENIRRGKRLLPPRGTPSLMYSLMLSTWKLDPSSRPSFRQIATQIEQVASSQFECGRMAPSGTIGYGMMQTEEGEEEEYTSLTCPQKREEEMEEERKEEDSD